MIADAIYDECGRYLAPAQTELAPIAHRFRIECSWCNDVLDEGTPGAETSHTCCTSCLREQMLIIDNTKETK